jgi:hypothetical protein
MFKRCKVVICGRHTGWVLKGIVGNCNVGFLLILMECKQISEWIRNYCVSNNNILFTANGLSLGGSGSLTQIHKHEIWLLLD